VSLQSSETFLKYSRLKVHLGKTNNIFFKTTS
jgi:hypothetical protein